ncbi:MAG: hypothetical protein L3J18_03930 [Candidatus Brocadia sp.]|nr:MAG: hypothetical protein L3J18_03930 [Candidatus Brocadia sp.]
MRSLQNWSNATGMASPPSANQKIRFRSDLSKGSTTKSESFNAELMAYETKSIFVSKY